MLSAEVRDQLLTAYEKLDRLNFSRLKLLEKSPIHFQKGFSDEESDPLRMGTAAHMAILEPPKFADLYVTYPARRAGKAWEAFRDDAEAAGKLVLSVKEMAETLAMRDAVQAHDRAMDLLSGGRAEVPAIWDIEGEGFRFECKGRIDYKRPRAIVDLKSTRCAEPKAFARSVMQYGYLGQAAWYVDGWNRMDPADAVDEFYFVAVESSAPHIVEVYHVTPEQLAQGRAMYARLLGTLDYCQKNNAWGGYTGRTESDLIMPSYFREEE